MNLQDKIASLKRQQSGLIKEKNTTDTTLDTGVGNTRFSLCSMKNDLSALKKQKAYPTSSSMGSYSKDVVNLNPDADNTKIDLNSIKNNLSALKQQKAYPTNFSKSVLNKIRLTVMLDISSSMKETEKDIYDGMIELCKNHQNDNVLLTLVVFNKEMRTVCRDMPISLVKPKMIVPSGETNLNGTLYHTIRSFDPNDNIHNLFVTISDGFDNVYNPGDGFETVSEKKVADLIRDYSYNLKNHFYFLGECLLNPELEPVIMASALRLGYSVDNIQVFTRKGAGNKLNFQVISSMIDDLLYGETISPDWNAPIREHYLSLTTTKGR